MNSGRGEGTDGDAVAVHADDFDGGPFRDVGAFADDVADAAIEAGFTGWT